MRKYKVQEARNERHAKKGQDIRFQTKLYAVILLVLKNVIFDL